MLTTLWLVVSSQYSSSNYFSVNSALQQVNHGHSISNAWILWIMCMVLLVVWTTGCSFSVSPFRRFMGRSRAEGVLNVLCWWLWCPRRVHNHPKHISRNYNYRTMGSIELCRIENGKQITHIILCRQRTNNTIMTSSCKLGQNLSRLSVRPTPRPLFGKHWSRI